MRNALLTLLLAVPLSAATDADRLYVEAVEPLLKQRCLGCHGEADTFAALDLTTREAALKGGQRGPSIIPGDAEASLLVRVVEHRGDLLMPPGGAEKKLSAESLAAIREWVAGGAPYAASEVQDDAAAWRDFEEADIWAFRPVEKVAPPSKGVNPAGVRTPVDSFILAKLAAAGLEPAPRADKLTLLRRVSYDLTGLPPTPEEVEDFVNDESEGAYKKVVERLLASPAYGESWGRHWLDVTRYADTAGYSNDFERPTAWRYRDYVIRSFNQDKPYDRFVLEQIAGDELWPEDPEALIATGMLRAGPWEHTGMAVAAVTRQLFLDDVTHSVGTTFLGLTLGCARCHDHKFDPIPTKDYYSMQAVFAGTAFARRPLGFLEHESQGGFDAGRARFDRMIAQLERRIEQVHDEARERLAAEQGEAVARAATSQVLQRSLEGEQAETLKLLRKQLAMHRESRQRFEPLAFSVTSGLRDEWNDVGPSGSASYLKAEDYRDAETFVLVGGDVQAPGEPVEAGALAAVARYARLKGPRIPDTLAGRRSGLARWIVDAANPLTARVMVNRIWQYHFGRGLAVNTNNMGKMGGKPSHPELLDWLAGFFLEQGWSIKAVHRVILYSEAYQRTSLEAWAEAPDELVARLEDDDPNNALLAVFTPRRLAAEELRDSILAAAGELSPLRGGPGSYPRINSKLARQPRHAMGTLRPDYRAAPTKAERNRRSIYSFQQRSLIDPLIETFNGANVDLSCERRESSVVPTQAFALINSELSHETALAMAVRLEREAETEPRRIERAFRLAFGRAPTAEETAAAASHLERMRAVHASRPAPPRRPEPPVVHQITSELTGEQYAFEQTADESDEYEYPLHPSEASPETRALADLALALLNANEFVYVY